MILLSLADVHAMWPETSRPSLRTLREFAVAKGCCRRLGRGLAFTPADVERLLGEQFLTKGGPS